MTDALIQLENYKICEMKPDDLTALLKENLGGGKLQLHNLDEIKFPSQTSTTWDIPDITQKDGFRSIKDLTCVIILWNDIRRYWETEYGAGDPSAPDCRSDDLETGVGDPGGECKSCEFSEWGSDTKGPGERCKQSRELLLALPDKLLPVRLSIGPGSLKNIRQYFMQLVTSGIPYWKALTSFTLKTEKSTKDIKYPQCNVQLIEQIPEEYLASIDSFRNAVTGNVDQS